MYRSLSFIVSIAATSFHFIDINNPAWFYSIILPLVFIVSLIALALWFVALFHKLGIKQRYDSSSDSDGFWDGSDGGGDC